MWSFDPIFITYVLVGPVAWLLLGLGMYLGAKRMQRLVRWRGALPEPAPAVTVLVPAKDEGPRIQRCIESILQQEYPGLTIVAIDDRSEDDTGAVLDRLAEMHPGKVRAVHVPKGGLPEGWLGKCHALHVGAKQVEGQWLMFIDSDVRLLRPDAIARAVALSVSRDYDALSILTRLECDTFFARLVLPLAAGAWSIMHTISLTNDDNRPEMAYANGQFFLIRRSMYEQVGGHESVRDCITEDVELMRRMKQARGKTRLLLGNTLASTFMHASFRQMLKGWGRIYSGTARRSPWRIIGAIVFLVICGFSIYPAIAWGIWDSTRREGISPWIIAAGIHFIARGLVLMKMYRESGNPAGNALLFPWAGATLIALLAFALKWCITGRIEWRGTTFDQNAARRA